MIVLMSWPDMKWTPRLTTEKLSCIYGFRGAMHSKVELYVWFSTGQAKPRAMSACSTEHARACCTCKESLTQIHAAAAAFGVAGFMALIFEGYF